MKRTYRNLILAVSCACLGLSACKKAEFVDVNTNPETLYDIPAANQFMNAIISAHDNRFEWYYDFYRRIMPWMQMNTATAGNGKTFIEDAGNFNNRYETFYGGVGNKLVDITNLIEKLPAEEQEKMVYMKAIPNVLLAYYTFYVSDINGSIPFEESFQARYGGTFTPGYNTQEQIFNSLDGLLKETIATLKSTPSVEQQSYGQYDLYYNGDVSKWIKAANALRLKIAMRLMKRDPDKMKAIAMEILSNPAADLMSSNEDSWVFDAISGFTGEGGDWSPEGLRAPKSTVDFMLAQNDPRIGLYYEKNKWGQYVGSVSSPDAAESNTYKRLYSTEDTLSNLQYRMFQASFDGGTGTNYLPVITFADFAFMRAELAARTVTAENAADWYNTSVTASIKQYDTWAKNALITDYMAVTDADIAAYLAEPTIKYDAAKGIEQIAIQAYLNYFKQPNEAWALYKRTGYPNPTSALAFEKIISDGVEQEIPRRAPLRVLPPTDLNYANNQAALQEMAKDPGFGNGPSDVFGRVWWDSE